MKFSIEAITHTLLGHLSVSTWQSPPSAAHREASLSRFNWSTISPTSELIYEDCYKGLECSRLEVPLDWSNLSNPNKVVLAIARLPAVVNESDPSFGGTIVLNPGGPGGSGIDLIVKTGRWLQKIVDSDKHFELLSFDPRGVHYTTPPSACFGDPLSRQVWDLKNKATGPVDLTQEVIDIKWSAYEGLGKLCEERADFPDGSSILKYSSTPLVARDMVAIIDKLDDRLRKTLRAQANVLERPNDKNGELQDVLASAGDKSQEKPLLQYWGFSYGTILGNYFATLHPDRIGRMILDGVADANDYHGSPGWVTNLVDADAVLDSFYSYCYDGGDRCPLYRKADKGPQDIEGRVNALLERLLINPMATVHNGTTELITFADLRMQFVSALYGPLQYFPGLAQVLADLMFGNSTSMITRLVHLQLPSVEATRELEVDEDPDIEREPVPFPEVSYDHGDEATNAILCGDRDLWPEVTKAAFREYVNILTGQSKTCGASKFSCSLRSVPGLAGAQFDCFV